MGLIFTLIFAYLKFKTNVFSWIRKNYKIN